MAHGLRALHRDVRLELRLRSALEFDPCVRRWAQDENRDRARAASMRELEALHQREDGR